MIDEEIVGLFLKRSEKAIEETQSKYKKYCAYISGNILSSREDVEECVNDVLAAVWNSIPPQKPTNLKTYIGKLTRRISISRYRQNHAGTRCPSEFSVALDEIEEIAVDEDFDAKVDKEILSKAISDFLHTLPEPSRNLMIRRYWYNDSIKSISERYGFNEGKVKVTLQRTREKLAEFLKKEGYIT